MSNTQASNAQHVAVIAERMLNERWGRMIDDPNFKKPPQWSPNDNPRTVAAEYLRVYPRLLELERELETNTKLLEEISDRIHGLPAQVSGRIRASRGTLNTDGS